MSDLPPFVVELGDPGQLVAALPYLLRYHPSKSLVAVLLTEAETLRVTSAAQTDLPLLAAPAAYAHELAIAASRHRIDAVVLVVVGNGELDLPTVLPHQDLVAEFEYELAVHGVDLIYATWAGATKAASPWCCYDATATHGVVPAPDQTPLAAASVAIGRVTLDSRADWEALLTPDDDAALARRAQRIDELAATTSSTLSSDAVRQLRLIRAAIEAIEAGQAHLDDEQIAQLAIALTDVTIRDICLGTSLGPYAPFAEQLWLQLTKSVPPPHRAEPATLLAVATYLRGDGVMSGIALDNAEAAQPDHLLAGILRQGMSFGLPSEIVADAIERASSLAEQQLTADLQD
jgi:hypothetical protein